MEVKEERLKVRDSGESCLDGGLCLRVLVVKHISLYKCVQMILSVICSVC